jgi:4-hydroxybenzoate polyprenyltransferase
MGTIVTGRHYSMVSLAFWKAYGITMRPYLLFVSGITGIAGLSFSQGMPLGRTLLIALASFLSYGFGQALTDCFQTDTDALSAPYRPLTQGVIAKTQVLFVSLAGLGLCAAAFAAFFPANILLGLAAAAGLATYTPFKRMWWSGPFYNAWIVALLCVIALGAGSGSLAAALDKPFVFALLTVFFGYANFVLAGYFKDISADAATGYWTLPVVFGRKFAAAVSDALALATVVSFIFYCLSRGMSAVAPIPAVFVLAAAACTAVGQVRLHRVMTDGGAHRAVAFTVHSYMLILSAVAVTEKPSWSIFLILYFGAYALILRFRPERQQI